MRLRFFSLLAAVGLFATACGGGGSGPSRVGLPTSPSPTGASEPASPPGHGHCAADLAANAADHGGRAAAGPADRIAAGDFFFDPTCLADVPAGTFSLLVTNSGVALHNFSLPAQGIDQDTGPGQKVTVTITVGTTALQYFCKYHRTSGHGGSAVAGPDGGGLMEPPLYRPELRRARKRLSGPRGFVLWGLQVAASGPPCSVSTRLRHSRNEAAAGRHRFGEISRKQGPPTPSVRVSQRAQLTAERA